MTSGVIELTTALKINGQDFKELTYDLGKISIYDLAEIEKERVQILGPKAGSVFRVMQNDPLIHFLLGAHAIIKCNPSIDINDLNRLVGFDLCQLTTIGMRFFSRPAAQDSSNSEKQPEDIQDNSIVQSANSTENQ